MTSCSVPGGGGEASRGHGCRRSTPRRATRQVRCAEGLWLRLLCAALVDVPG